jgi:DNA processing protein
MSSEALASAVNQPLSETLAALTELEIEGVIVCENGRWIACTG